MGVDFILKLVIAFIIRQLGKFGVNTDWTKIKADLEVRIRALVPGVYFDDVVVAAMVDAVDTLAKALKDEKDLKAVADAIIAKDWAAVVAALTALLSKESGASVPHLIAALEDLRAA